MTDAIKDAARGRWPEILSALGVDEQYLRLNRNGPCPGCGGVDRYSYTDKWQDGNYICRQCGAGDGFELLKIALGMPFKDSIKEVGNILGVHEVGRPSQSNEKQKARAALNKILKGCDVKDRSKVMEYLQSRGLSVYPKDLKYHPALPYFNDDGQNCGEYPAMIAAVVSVKGTLQSLHRTYLSDEVRTRKKLSPPVGSIAGGAIRLFPAGEILGVAEGIETAIAAYELWRMKHGKPIPVWATVAAGNMEKFQWPPTVQHLVIFGDNDANYTGQKATYVLAARAASKGLTVEPRIPPGEGDWLDFLNELKERRAA